MDMEKSGMKRIEIAKTYHVNWSTIDRIFRKETWSHIHEQ